MGSEHSHAVAAQALAAIGLVLSFGSFTLFYMYKSQRKFPVSLLGWISVSNMLMMIIVLYFYFGGMSGFGSAIGQGDSPASCRLLYAVDNFILSFNVCCNTFLAITLYVSVARRQSMEYSVNPWYFKGFVLAIIAWVVVLTTVAASLPQIPDSSCAVEYLYNLAMIIPNMCLLCAQVVLVSITITSIWRIIKSVRSNTSNKHDHRLFLLISRFVPVMLSQLLELVPQYVASLGDIAGPQQTDIIFILLATAAILDSVVLIATNRSLLRTIRRLLNYTVPSSSLENVTSKERSRGRSESVNTSSVTSVTAASSPTPMQGDAHV